jgi:hypothetical protein
MSDQDLSYRLPPDVLHYETKYMFGLNLQDLLVAVMPSLMVLNTVGPAWGAITAAIMLAGLKRWDNFGDRSVIVYLALLIWYRYRPGEVQAPRVLPLHPSRVEVHSWDGNRLYVIEGEEKA